MGADCVRGESTGLSEKDWLESSQERRYRYRCKLTFLLLACFFLPFFLLSDSMALEALALLLRIELRALKYAERRSSAKARSSPHLIPRSTISDVALDLLERSEWRYPLGEQLVDLFRELLNLENPKQQYPRELEAQEKAANILAHNPQIGVAELAKAVGVNKSSVSRWMKRPDFQDRVKRAAESKIG